jgi:hypothetical protein
MENPWNKLLCVQNQYYLDDDNKIILQNNRTSVNTDTHIDLTYLPEPFIGNKAAKIYFLLANPGRVRNESNVKNVNAELKEAVLRNLRHEDQDFPFYPLNHRLTGTAVYKWWEVALGDLIKTLNTDEKTFANNFFSVWLYGYHSYQLNIKFLEKGILRLPSVDYTVYLVKNAIRQKKIILIGRSVGIWLGLVPELKNYDHCFFVVNTQKMILSETSLSPLPLRLIRKTITG